MFRRRPGRAPRCLLALILALSATSPALADMVYLKDGFVLMGKVKRENSSIVDKENNEVIKIGTGFFYVDDGARRHYFPLAQVQQVDEMYVPQEDSIINGGPIILPPNTKPLPPVLEMLDVGDWNDKWERQVTYRSPERRVTMFQRLSVLNSYFVRVDSPKYYRWNSYYLTRELGADQVRDLLTKHPDFLEPPTLDEAARVARRFRFAQFFARAGWYDHAEAELDRIARDFPKKREDVQKEREALRRYQVEELIERIQHGEQAGRYRWVLKQIEDVPTKLATPKAQAQLATIKTRITDREAKLTEITRHLDALFGKLDTADDRKFFEETLTALRGELTVDLVQRFESFLIQARQYERQVKAKKRTDETPAQLLSLAVSGWLMGNAAGELKPETARRLWRGRQFLAEYVKDPDSRSVAGYEKEKEALAIDEMAQLISMAGPTDPDPEPPAEVTEKTAGQATYLLKLPPEYRHSRSYPVLVLLHDSDQSPRDILRQFNDHGAMHGYILASLDWTGGKGGNHRWSTDEHARVHDLLMDLKRSYNVDCDRIFLFGLGQGGSMAYDVGLSHPDWFAGVLPMATSPQWFSKHYWPNAMYLPFYVVGGDQCGDNNIRTREQFDKWVPHGYPVMFVQYKGRSNEWFGGEMPSMFDWMSRKKRFFPLTQMGRFGSSGLGDQFQSFRESDNRFYWLSGDVHPRHFNGNPDWSPRVYPANVWARIDPASNSINLNPVGFKNISVWLARTGQIDFEKPVTVRVGVTIMVANRKVKPMLGILLEDYARRLDRQQLWVGRIDLKL